MGIFKLCPQPAIIKRIEISVEMQMDKWRVSWR